MQIRRKHRKATPQRLASVAQAARRPMLGRYEIRWDTAHVVLVSPVEFHDVADPEVRKPSFQSQRHQKQRWLACRCRAFCDAQHRSLVEVVVVVVRNQHHVNQR